MTRAASGPGRRDRLRAEMTEQIAATARRLLADRGPRAASLRAIAREMGMTAPGLYRYYGSREHLLRHVADLISRDLADRIRQAVGASEAAAMAMTALFGIWEPS